MGLFPQIDLTIKSLDVERIDEARKEELNRLAKYIKSKLDSNQSVALHFICTHNSRRSQFAQVWSHVLSRKFQLPLDSFSGGTEVTACHENVLKILHRSGMRIHQNTGVNPRHGVEFSSCHTPMTLYSKQFDHIPEPEQGFAAVMTCDHADHNCPIVPGAEQRFALHYEDPKHADSTDSVLSIYNQCSRKIATELLYAFDLATQ